jgi:hypothetical protein
MLFPFIFLGPAGWVVAAVSVAAIHYATQDR